MDQKVMYALSYGLFILSARQGDKDNGCITNTAIQVTSEPNRIAIAVNKAKDHLKSAYNRRMAVTEAPGDTAPALAAAQNAPSLEAECETRADAGLARECIEGLAEPYRTVSVLYFMQEWPVEAIARQLGRMPKTVHTQLYRAKKMLRRELAAVG